MIREKLIDYEAGKKCGILLSEIHNDIRVFREEGIFDSIEQVRPFLPYFGRLKKCEQNYSEALIIAQKYNDNVVILALDSLKEELYKIKSLIKGIENAQGLEKIAVSP